MFLENDIMAVYVYSYYVDYIFYMYILQLDAQ